MQLQGIFSRSVGTAGALVADTEYYVGSGVFDTNHAVTALCNGCLLPASLTFNFLLLQQPPGTPGGDVSVTTPNVRNIMTWQLGPVPVRRPTRGQVKSLYR